MFKTAYNTLHVLELILQSYVRLTQACTYKEAAQLIHYTDSALC